MSDVAIRVENLGKRYRIGMGPQRANSLRAALGRMLASPFDHLVRSLRQPTEEEVIWALKDVSFEVKQGEVVGIIGRNGAGKSTLLKILSRITEPTTGYADIEGRVGSLLEIGTGFHPELTGRENIYMNGAILGMSKAEIDAKLDEIVAFSGVEKFIDTPVKRYSSGMYVRLGFAVAAHLEPEILLVDEVLAVGDVAFQQKCLGKMEDISHMGRTVLFVSHNIGIIEKLCPHTLLLQGGHQIGYGSTQELTRHYLAELSQGQQSGEDLLDRPRRHAHYGGQARFAACTVLDAHGHETATLQLGEPFAIGVDLVGLEDMHGVEIVVRITNWYGQAITTVSTAEAGTLLRARAGQRTSVRAVFENLVLNTGRYFIELYAMKLNRGLDVVIEAAWFEVTDSRYQAAGEYRALYGLEGAIRYRPHWEINGKDSAPTQPRATTTGADGT